MAAVKKFGCLKKITLMSLWSGRGLHPELRSHDPSGDHFPVSVSYTYFQSA